MQGSSGGRRRRLLTGDEQDVHNSRWRAAYYWTQRPGATAKAKRRTRRRERRDYDRDLRRGDW